LLEQRLLLIDFAHPVMKLRSPQSIFPTLDFHLRCKNVIFYFWFGEGHESLLLDTLGGAGRHQLREENYEDADEGDLKAKKKKSDKTVLPELSPLEDVADAEAGSALGSDLDSEAFSEPEIEDHIFASKVEIKSRKNGLWRAKLHNGVCKINKEETLFKQADCTFNFSEYTEDLRDDQPLM
jgi:hypothetical protein